MIGMKESELGVLFQKFICNDHGLGYHFDMLFEEIESMQGIPDYIGVRIKNVQECRNFLNTFSNENWFSISKILSCLSYKRGYTLNHILKKTGIAEHQLEKMLLQLVRKKILNQDDKNKYMINDSTVIPHIDVISFELKMENWKRALFQSIRYKTFSDYVYIVMPIEKQKLLEKNIEIFISNNIGIALYDEKLEALKIMVRPKKNQKKSKMHCDYMSGKILFECKLEKQLSSTIKIV